MNTEIYRRMVDALATIRHLEQQGCRVTGAHCALDTTSIHIDPPPDAILDHWAYTIVPPPRGIAAPVTLRLELGAKVYVEWSPTKRPAPRRVPAPTADRAPWSARRAPGIACQEVAA